LDAGCTEFFVKPIDIRKLNDAIANVLSNEASGDVTEGFDGVHHCSTPSGVDSENDTDRDRNTEGQWERPWDDDRSHGAH